MDWIWKLLDPLATLISLAKLYGKRYWSRGRLERVGTMSDNRSIMRIGTRLAEFDSFAYEFYASLDDSEKARVARTIRANDRDAYSRGMLAAIQRSRPISAGPVYRMERTVRGVRFWTQLDFDELSDSDKAIQRQLNGDLWRLFGRN